MYFYERIETYVPLLTSRIPEHWGNAPVHFFYLGICADIIHAENILKSYTGTYRASVPAM